MNTFERKLLELSPEYCESVSDNIKNNLEDYLALKGIPFDDSIKIKYSEEGIKVVKEVTLAKIKLSGNESRIEYWI